MLIGVNLAQRNMQINFIQSTVCRCWEFLHNLPYIHMKTVCIFTRGVWLHRNIQTCTHLTSTHIHTLCTSLLALMLSSRMSWFVNCFLKEIHLWQVVINLQQLWQRLSNSGTSKNSDVKRKKILQRKIKHHDDEDLFCCLLLYFTLVSLFCFWVSEHVLQL